MTTHYIVEPRSEDCFSILRPGEDTSICVAHTLESANKVANALNAPKVGDPCDILPGTFTLIEAPVAAAKGAKHNPIAAAHAALIDELRLVAVPRIHLNPDPEEFEDVADYLLRAAAMVDRWVRAVGTEVKLNSSGVGVDMSLFQGQLESALSGNAIHECDRCANAVREDRAEYVGGRVRSLGAALFGAER